MEFAETVTTLYRRCTISPSVARNTSSPCSRNARRAPSAPVAVPKNFKSIGGGGGGPGGGGGGPGTTFAVRTGAIGFGISTGTELLEKIFLPPPEYTNDSVTSIAAIRNVGSSCAEVVPKFFAALPTAFPGGTEITVPVFAPTDPLEPEAPTEGAAVTGAVTTTVVTGAGPPCGSSKYKTPPASNTNPATAATFFCRSGVIFIIALGLRPQYQ
jgi:hypothetical protein